MTTDSAAYLLELIEKRQEILALEDGYYYFFPKDYPYGCFSSWMLHAIADDLDRRNKPWNDEVQAFFSKEDGSPRNLEEFLGDPWKDGS